MGNGGKDTAKWRVAIIGIGFVIGVALLLFGGGAEEKSAPMSDSAESYRASLEEKLELLCESFTGGEVSVFVSLEGGFSYSYAPDSRGGVVTVGSGSSESALVESTEMPRVAGVGVVYSGAENARLEGELLGLVSSSLGVGTNKIFIISSKKSAGLS